MAFQEDNFQALAGQVHGSGETISNNSVDADVDINIDSKAQLFTYLKGNEMSRLWKTWR